MCQFIPTSPASPYSSRSSSHRERGSRRCFVGKDRRLRHGLTWQPRRGGSVQGFPCGHYGPCVLDGDGGTGEGRPPACRDDVRRKCLDIATAGTEQRNGREQKSPDGRPQGRMFLLRLATERPPVFPILSLSKGSIMARPTTGRGKDEARPPPPRWGRWPEGPEGVICYSPPPHPPRPFDKLRARHPPHGEEEVRYRPLAVPRRAERRFSAIAAAAANMPMTERLQPTSSRIATAQERLEKTTATRSAGPP